MVLPIFSKKLSPSHPPPPSLGATSLKFPVLSLSCTSVSLKFISQQLSPLNSWTVGSVCYLSLSLIQPFYLAHKCDQNVTTFENKYQ